MENYNIGLDIGTSSVGWAVVNDATNKVMRKSGKSLWGVRLFEEAQKAEYRRIKRSTRRRYDRRRERIKLLQKEFKDEINKVDNEFFQKLRETKYKKDDSNNKKIAITTFVPTTIAKLDENYVPVYTNKNDEKFKTIYHLRSELMVNPAKFDIRLVYLAIHHIIKYRGNFIYEGQSFNIEKLDIPTKLEEIFISLSENVSELDITDDCLNNLNYLEITNIINKYSKSKNDLKVNLSGELARDFLNLNRKFIKEFCLLIVGNKFNVKNLFNLDIEQDIKISFEGTDLEDKAADLEKDLGDYVEVLDQLKELYDMIFLTRIFEGSKELSISKLMVERFNQHAKDLRLLKNTFKSNRKIYNKIFRSKKVITKDSDMCLYDSYIHNKLENTEFFNELKKYINNDKFIINDDDFLKRLENNDILPRITSKENGKYPYQLNKIELEKIIENQGKYYPFLLDKTDEGNYKLVQLLEFKIPYFVGPLVSSAQSKNAWLIRNEGNEHEHIDPYNFKRVVNLDKTAEIFIRRMISHCTYLLNEEALPNNSILYSEFKVLNELKQIKINGEHLTQGQQHKIIEELFMKTDGTITENKFSIFLQNELDYKFYDDDLKITGYSADGKFANNMQSYVDFFGENGIFKGTSYNINDAEKIIEWITIFDDKDILRRKLENEYPELINNNQVESILNKKYSGWGRLSRKLLLDLRVLDKKTNIPKSIMDLMYETDENFMQIINNDEYGFQKLIADNNSIEKPNKELSYDVVENLATSPATKRGIYQALKVVKEIIGYMGYEPKNIMIEMARGNNNDKKTRKDDRKKYLQKLYDEIKGEALEVNSEIKRLRKELDVEEKIDTDKLYLYYLQEGKCLYCGEPIDVLNMKTNNSDYEIDHILPRTLIKDNSWDNRALVCREHNQEKGASLVLPTKFNTEKTRKLWNRLKDNKLMSNKKFYLLTRKKYSEEDIKGFINRQLVETRQITKHVANILNNFYPKTKIVYFKAGISSSYRDKYDLFKFRDLNDYHHAHDAYLAATLGNYQEKYLRYDLDYNKINEFNETLVKNKDYKKLHYGIVVNSLDEEFQEAFAEIAPRLINSETGELLFNAKKFNDLIEDTLYRNDILVSRKTEIKTGKLYKETIYKKGVGNIKMKGNMPTEIYGGYSNMETSYLTLVKYGKKTKLVGIPMNIANDKDNKVKLDFIKEHLGLKSIDDILILKDNIPYDVRINYKNQDVYIKGYGTANKVCELSNAHQLKVKKDMMKKCKYVLNKVYKTKYDDITSLDMENAITFINYLFEIKKEYPLFSKEITKIQESINLAKCSFEQLANIIKQLLLIYHCNSKNGNLKEFGLSDRIGRLSGANVTGGRFMFTSVTGLKTKTVNYDGAK